MTAFKLDENNTLDWEMLSFGGVSLYSNRTYLAEDIEWLRGQGYVIYTIDCATWITEDSIHDTLQTTLSFPAYYGRNLNALIDCLEDLDVPNVGGVAIVLESYHLYAHGTDSPGTPPTLNDAKTILDIFATVSRYFLLTGRRFIALVQSDNPRMHFEGLAAVGTHWNRREWLNKDRGL